MDAAVVDTVHAAATWLMLVTGVASFLALLFIEAPYGRYSKGGAWGPLINAKVAWVVWEAPSLLVPSAMLYVSGVGSQLLAEPWSKRALLAAAFLLHYSYRVLVFPMRTRAGKPAPLSVMLLGMSFCLWNGFLQGWHIIHQVAAGVPLRPLEALGLGIWMFGWLFVMHSDATLILLRKPGETGYKIPRGGLFEYVSSANYCAEVVEWFGYALIGASLPTAAFAFFTFCNLVPRGVAHHRWYLEKFDDYPKGRKAVLPGLW